VALCVAGYAIWWYATHVSTVQAAVHMTVVSLATEVDARMQDLHVKPGQRVTRGQLLARLDDSALMAALASAEAEKSIRESFYEQAKANAALARSEAEAEIALARTRVEIAQAKVDSTQALLDMRRGRIPAEITRAQALRDESLAKLQHLRKGLRQETIEAARARMATAKARTALSALQLKQTEELVKKNIESPLALEVRKTDLLAQQNEVREAELKLAELEAGPTTEEVEAAKQALAAREADLALARSGDKEPDMLAADLAMRKAELREAETLLKRAEDKRAQVVLAEEQVKAAAAELRKAEADVAGRKALLRTMSIISPVDGTVIRTFEHEGEVCRKGVPTILVSDEAKGAWIEGFIGEYDAHRVKVGQRATVEVVIGSGNYVKAVIEAVGLSTSAIGRDGSNSTPASPDSLQMVWLKLRPEKPIPNPLPGMTASAVIRVP